MEPLLHHVILAGGSGTRFWPASRRNHPKQFLALAGGSALIRQTFIRCTASGAPERIFVSAGEEHRAGVLAALPELDAARFIAEPEPRNTAPAIGLAALRLAMTEPGAVAVFCPADHVYADPGAYGEAIGKAAAAALEGDFLVTLGIAPRRPETGYGYIEAEGPGPLPHVRRVSRFVEKPDLETARKLASSGRHYWNSGVFVFKVSSILDAIGRHHPVLAAGLARIREAAERAGISGAAADPLSAPGVARTIEDVFATQPSISIDYAVMEKASNVLVVPCDPGWCDVGSWDAVFELGPADAAGNVLAGDVLAVGSHDNFVRAGSRLVAIVGVEGLIVVDTPDALLVCRRGESQKVREVVASLEALARKDLT